MAKRVDKALRIKRIREKLQHTNLGGGAGYYKPKVGQRNKIRILPGVGEMEDLFWQDVGRHYVKSASRPYVCPDFTIGDPCPICEFVKELYGMGTADAKELAGELYVRKQYWMNIIDRNDEDRGPMIYTPGVTVFRQIAGYASDPDYGELILDEDEGLDLIIIRTGQGLNTRYELRPVRNTSPLHSDSAVIDRWLEGAADLTPMVLSDNPSEDNAAIREDGNIVVFVSVLPYERMKAEFGALDLGEKEKESPSTDEENGAGCAIRRRRARRSRR